MGKFKRIAPPGMGGLMQRIDEINGTLSAHESQIQTVNHWIGVSEQNIVTCFISPDGNDNELERILLTSANIETYIGAEAYISETRYGAYSNTKQTVTLSHLGYYLILGDPVTATYGDGTEQHPFFTINKACEYLSKHRAAKPSEFHIKALPGKYIYTEPQKIYHPDAVGVGGSFYIVLEKANTASENVVFRFEPTIETMNMSYPFITCEKNAVWISDVELEFFETEDPNLENTEHPNWKNSTGIFCTNNSFLTVRNIKLHNFAVGIQTYNGATLKFMGENNRISIDDNYPNNTTHTGETDISKTNLASTCGLLISNSTFEIAIAPIDTVNLYIINYQVGIQFETNSKVNDYTYPGADGKYGLFNLYISSFTMYAIRILTSSIWKGFVPFFHPFFKFSTYESGTDENGNVKYDYDFTKLVNDTGWDINDEFGLQYTAAYTEVDWTKRMHNGFRIYPILNSKLGYGGDSKFTNLNKILEFDMIHLSIIY